jgi:hypothetical protein
VAHGAELLAFAEAIVARDERATASARADTTRAMGAAAMVDAAGVASNFERMVRIADATGITLDTRMEQASTLVRAELGLDQLRRDKRKLEQ